MNFKQTFTALITPFQQGHVDLDSLAKLIRHQTKNNIRGFVVNGTTAESPTLTEEEVKNIYDFVRAEAGVGTTIIVGTGGNSTAKTIEMTKKAEQWGADAALVVVPYYNKPPQRGLVAHFAAVADSVSLPIILYNVPGRTITSLEPQSVAELAKYKNIIGIKEATGDMGIAKKIMNLCGSDFLMLSGDDGTYDDFIKLGGHGVISVASHVIPQQFVNWTAKKDLDSFPSYKELINLLFCEANPIPVKKAMQLMGVISSGEMRLPLVELLPENANKISFELKKLGVI